jgi:hypothetical protein
VDRVVQEPDFLHRDRLNEDVLTEQRALSFALDRA